MKTFIKTAAIAAFLASGAAFAQPGGQRADVNQDGDLTRAELVASIDARFARLDTNRDGSITPEERQAARQAMRAGRLDKRFERLDADKNGAISKAEMQAAHDQRGAKMGERRGKGGHGRHAMMGKRGGMGKANATVTKAEMQAKALEHFDRIDADKNGVVTKAERQQAMAARKAARS